MVHVRRVDKIVHVVRRVLVEVVAAVRVGVEVESLTLRVAEAVVQAVLQHIDVLLQRPKIGLFPAVQGKRVYFAIAFWGGPGDCLCGGCGRGI